MSLSFNEWNYPTKKVKKQLLALNPGGLLAHAVGNVLSIFIENEKKGFNLLASWAPFEQDISAMCWYNATDIPEVAVPLLVIASISKKVVIYDVCAQRNIIAFNLIGEEPATIVKWSPISSSRFFIGTGNGDLHCCSIILGKEAQFNIEWTINLDFKIDFISFEPNFSDNILVASKSGQLNFVSNIHSLNPVISPENYTLCGDNNNNTISSCDFIESSSNYLLVVSKLGTIIYAIEQQESFNLFKDHKLKYLYPVHSNGSWLIGVNDESMSLYESLKGNFHRIYELPICPNVSNLPAYQTEFVFNYDRIIFVSYNWWLTTVKLIKNKLFVTNRVRLIPDKPIDYSFRMKSIAICTRNGCVLSTRSILANKQKSNQQQQQKNKEEFDIPREDSDTNLADISNDISSDLEKIATKSIIYHQRRKSCRSLSMPPPEKLKDSTPKAQKPVFELIRENYSEYIPEKKTRNSDMLNKPDTSVHGRKSNYALKKGPIDLSQLSKNQKAEQGNNSNNQESSQQQQSPANSKQQQSPSQSVRSTSNSNLESPKKKQRPKTNDQQIKFVEPKPEAQATSSAGLQEKKELIPKFTTPASPPQKQQPHNQEKKDPVPKFSMPSSSQQPQDIAEPIPKFGVVVSPQQQQSQENKESIPKTSISVPSFTQTASKPSFPKTQFSLPSNSPESQSNSPQKQANDAIPSMGNLDPFKLQSTKSSDNSIPQFEILKQSKSIHADPTVLNQSRRLRSMSMHPSTIGDSGNAIKQIAENARKHYKNINEMQEDYTILSEFGNSRIFSWCFKVCDIPLTKIEWISATKILAFGTQMKGPHHVHHLYLIDLRLRSVTRVLGDRLNAINLPFTSLVINRYQKICAIVLGDTLVMFISFFSSTPKMIGSMSFDSKVIVSFSPTPESTKALLVCQNDVVFIDYDLKNGTIRQTEKCTLDIKKTITAALWKRMCLVLGDSDGNISIVSFSPYHREDCLNIKNEVSQIINYQQGTMLVIDSKNTAYIMSARKIDYTFPYTVKQIHQFSNNDFVVRGSGKGSLSVVSIKGKYYPTYTLSISRCMILKPRSSWVNLLKDAVTKCANLEKNSDCKFIEIAQQFGIPLVRKILIAMKHPNYEVEQIRFIRDIVITNSKLNDLTIKLSLMIGDSETARLEALRTEKSSQNYILNICKSILLRTSPDKEVVREGVMQLFLDDMYEEGINLFMIFGMWQEAVSKLVTIGNMKEAMSLLMLKIQDNEEDRKFMESIDKKLIDSDYMCMGLILVALSGGIKSVIDKFRDLGEFEQASFLEKIGK